MNLNHSWTTPLPPPDPGGGWGERAEISPVPPIHNRPQLKERRQGLRNEATPAERLLWSKLRHGNLEGFKFRRQHSVGWYILDFYCPTCRVAVEIDGDSHCSDDAVQYDLQRTAFLNSLNIKAVRFCLQRH